MNFTTDKKTLNLSIDFTVMLNINFNSTNA